jgi:hypothetical protein
LFSYFWTWLSSEEVLELDVEFLFLLDDDILLNDFFSLLDQSLLKSLNFLKVLPGVWISAFKLSPSMDIQWVLKFLGKSFDLKSFSQELLLKSIDFLS